MKWIVTLPASLLLVGCCYTNSDVVEYRQVTVTPTCCQTYRTVPCYRTAPCYRDVTIINEEPIDVTTTEIDYY